MHLGVLNRIILDIICAINPIFWLSGLWESQRLRAISLQGHEKPINGWVQVVGLHNSNNREYSSYFVPIYILFSNRLCHDLTGLL